MKFSRTFSSLALAAVATAQSSPGAPYDTSNYLPAAWNNSITIEPGTLYQISEAAVAPSFGVAQTNASTDQPFIAILIDINVVVNESTGIQSEFLHMFQPNLYANTSSGNLTINANGTNATTVVGAEYYPATPGPGEAHNYNIFLFEQPANFTMPDGFTKYNEPATIYDRIYFNLTQFASLGGLGEPVAANYFRVLNGTAAQTTAVESQTATSGVAFPTGFSFSTMENVTTTSASGTTLSGTAASTSASMTAGTMSSNTGSATMPTASASSASDTNDFGQCFVKAVCVAVAAMLPWIW